MSATPFHRRRRAPRLPRRGPGLLALVALLALTTLPTLSRALAFVSGPPAGLVAEICTPQGLQRAGPWQPVAADETPASPAAHLDACEFCLLAAAGLAPGPLAKTPGPVVPQAERGVLVRSLIARPPVWSPTRARGPPMAV